MNVWRKWIMLAGVGLPLAAGAAPFSVTHLSYSDHEPLGNFRTRFLQKQWLQQIEALSHGRIKVTAHWNGELAKGHQALDKVAAHETDLAVVVPEYYPQALPVHQLFKSFPAGSTGAGQVKFFQAAYESIPELDAELARQGVVRVFIATGYPAGLFTRRKINSLADMRGQRVHSASIWHQAFLENVGATPKTTPWGAGVTQALARGELDGLFVNLDGAADIQAQKIAPYWLGSEKFWLGHVYLVVMNQNAYTRLTPDERAILRAAAQSAYAKLGPAMHESYQNRLRRFAAEGVDVHELPDFGVDRWQTLSRYAIEQQKWIRKQPQSEQPKLAQALAEMEKLWRQAMR